jgi:hypothetical protein
MGKVCSTNGVKRNVYRILVGKPEGNRSLGRPRRSGRTILKWVLERKDGMVWVEFVWLRIWTNGTLLCTFGYHKMLAIS